VKAISDQLSAISLPIVVWKRIADLLVFGGNRKGTISQQSADSRER
jgi:hypothetical protein